MHFSRQCSNHLKIKKPQCWALNDFIHNIFRVIPDSELELKGGFLFHFLILHFLFQIQPTFISKDISILKSKIPWNWNLRIMYQKNFLGYQISRRPVVWTTWSKRSFPVVLLMIVNSSSVSIVRTLTFMPFPGAIVHSVSLLHWLLEQPLVNWNLELGRRC